MQPSRSQPLSILGASARAATASARRAGFAVCAVDLFADADTQLMARTIRISDYPGEFIAAAASLPQGPWLYTGGLENYPEIVDKIAALRPLWGNAGSVLRAVRDPHRWTEALREAGCRAPAWTSEMGDVPRDNSWLMKPLRSAGGLGVRVVDAALEFTPQIGREHYFQQRLQGEPVSAVFVAAENRSQFLGATNPLAPPWPAPQEFVYRGSVGPIDSSESLLAQLVRVGEGLARSFALQGLFGVDGIVCDGHFTTIEINPRYTASIEVLERATGANLLQVHADACLHAALPERPAPRKLLHGKAIVYASTASTFSSRAADWAAQLNSQQEWPVVADIPCCGEAIPAGSPIVTLFASSKNYDEVNNQLQKLAAELRSLLAAC
jgi:predicted ATP-grasp superfamily ATP-dependent carboligase